MALKVISVVLTGDASSLRSQLALAAREVDAFGKKVSGVNASASGSAGLLASGFAAAGVAVAAATAYAVKGAADFEAAMRNVNSISGLSEASFEKLSKSVLSLSTSLPQSATTLAKGLYEIASSGFQGAEGLEVLQKSAVAASAGLTTTNNSAKAITAVLNAYGKSAFEAGAVSDVLFQTVNLGVVNFEELTGVIGDTVGAAAAAGVSIEEVGAAVATMTLSGISASEAGTSLNRVLVELIKPGEQLQEVLKSLGYESGLAAIEQLGLRGTMDLLRTATGGTADSVVALFKEVRGARGAFALMANDGEKYREVAEGIGLASDGVGASQKALNEQMKSLSAQWKVFTNQADAARIALGARLLPILGDLMAGVRSLAGDAMPALQSAGAALAPFFESLREIGSDIIEIVGELVDSLGPLAAALVGIAGAAVISTLNTLAGALSAVTGFLADHESAVTAAALAYAGFFLVTRGAAVLALLPAALDAVAISMYGAAGAADTAAASLLTLKGAALGLAAVVTVLGFTAAINGMQKAKRSADEMYASIVKPFDLSTYKGLSAALDEIGVAQQDLESNTKSHGGLFNAFRGAVELVTPMKDSVQEAREAVKKLNEESERLAKLRSNFYTNLTAVSQVTGQSREDIEALAKSLGVDLTGGFDDSEGARLKIIDHLEQIRQNAYGAGTGLAAAANQSVDAIAAASKAVDDLAQKVGETFGKSFDLVSNFAAATSEHARALDDEASAASRATDAQDRIAEAYDRAAEAQEQIGEAQERVVDAEQRVADMRSDFAERAAENQERYAERVAESNADILDAETELSERRISLAQDVADAQRRLDEDKLKGAERIKAAEQRIRDVQKRSQDEARERQQRESDRRQLDAAKTPEDRRRIQAQIDARKAREDEKKDRERAAADLKSAQDDLAKARRDAEETEKKNREALAEAQIDQVRGIEEAEKNVADARKAGLAVQKEGAKLARQAVEDEKAIADAVKQVEDARRGVLDAQKNASRAARDVGKAQGEAAEAYADLAEAQGRVADTSLDGFFAKTIEDARRFAEGIREAARQGLDPELIKQLLEEGPEKAAPILDAIMKDQTGRLVAQMNEARDGLKTVQGQMVEAARVTQRAINASTTEMAAEFGTAMDILEAKASMGGAATAAAIAEKLSLGVADVERIAKDYVIVLAAGINPLLRGIGAPPVQLDQIEGGRVAGAQKYADGGPVAGHGDGDTVPAMLTPGEYVISKPAVQRIGVDNLDAMHQEARRGFATGGFVYPSDVPKPPPGDLYGAMLGHAGSMVNKKAYDEVVAFVRAHPPEGGEGTGSTAGGGAGGGYGYQALIDYLTGLGVANDVTSTVRPGSITSSGNLSLHSAGLAADFVSSNMREIFDTFLQITPSLQELFYDPAGFSVKRGQRADWTVGGHDDHVHAATWGGPGEGPGVPEPADLAAGALRSYDKGGWLPPGISLAHNGTGRPEAVGGAVRIDYDALAQALRRAGVGEAVFNVNGREFARATAGDITREQFNGRRR